MDGQSPRAIFTLLISLAVVSIAIFLRLPSCYESLWLDELHSAWIIADDIGSVYQRSIIGHQSPCYYFQLWVWKQVVGDSELILRLNSVLMVAGGCGVIAYGITNWTHSLLAGFVSGLILAMENNSLFFGTELRPFALVILCSSISIVIFLHLLSSESRHTHSTSWCLLIITILFSAICQPTCLGVLAWLPFCLCGIWLIRSPKQFGRFTWLDTALITITLLTTLMLWQMTLRQSWAEKSMWGSFATATHWQQIWNIWDWSYLLIIPSIPLLTILIIGKFQRSKIKDRSIVHGLGFIVALTILTTLLYWCLSSLEIVPVWHRRYFIAVLPILACFGGGCLGYVQLRLADTRTSAVGCVVLAASIIIFLGVHQGTLEKLRHYPVALVKRGEDWRNAIEWLEQESSPESVILLDSGLIEGRSWITPKLFENGNDAKLGYLSFPVRGPYWLNRDVMPVGRMLQPAIPLPNAKNSIYILTRDAPARTKQRVANREIMGFGGVSVVIPEHQEPIYTSNFSK